MKKLRSFVLLYLLTICSWAQNKPQKIVYDFKDGSVKIPTSIRQGETVVLEVDNINTLGFTVKITGAVTNYETQVPTELQTAFRLSTQQSQNIQGAVTNSNVATKAMQELTASNSNATLDGALQDLVSACVEYIDVVNQIQDWQIIKGKLVDLSTRIHLDPSDVKKSLGNNDLNALNSLYDDFVKKYTDAFTKYVKAQSVANSQLATAKAASRALKAKVAAAKPADKSAAEVADAAAKNKATNAASDSTVITKATKAFMDGYTALSQNLRQLIVDVNNLYTRLTDDQYYKVLSLPVQMDGDFIEFVVSIEPIQSNPSDGSSFHVKVPGKYGWKTDFSVGPTFSYGSGALDDKFYLTTPTDTTMRVINQGKNSSQVRPGLAAMMHAYVRTGKSFGIGPMFGVGAGFKSIDDVNVNFYLGLSAVLGVQQKVIFSIGGSYLSVDRLKSSYKLNNSYTSKSIANATLVEKAIQGSFFFSVSYNITSKVSVN